MTYENIKCTCNKDFIVKNCLREFKAIGNAEINLSIDVKLVDFLECDKI